MGKIFPQREWKSKDYIIRSFHRLHLTHAYCDINGRDYPVYSSKKGKYYISRVCNKSGRQYRQYLNPGISQVISSFEKKLPNVSFVCIKIDKRKLNK